MSVTGEGAEDDHDELYIENVDSVCKMDFKSVSVDDVKKYEFGNLDIAYGFYNVYAKLNGFSIRWYKVGRSADGSILWQTFVCCNEGYREAKHLERIDRKKEPKPLTR